MEMRALYILKAGGDLDVVVCVNNNVMIGG